MPTISLVKPAIILGLIIATICGTLWLIDEIGDRREQQVHQRYANEALRRNVEIGATNTEAERIGAVLDGVVAKALADAAKVPGVHPMTAEQAAALNAIRSAANAP